jgi:hypothetical protein
VRLPLLLLLLVGRLVYLALSLRPQTLHRRWQRQCLR